MPDSPVRGAHLLAATTQLIGAGGLAAVSIRAVATQAGVSLAQVQYYFSNKETLVEAAFEWHGDQFLTELSGLLAAEPSLPRLRQLVDRWLPLDEPREVRTRIWLAFVQTAALHQAVAARSAELDQAVRAWFEADLHHLAERELLSPADPAVIVDPAVTAAQLLALVDGVCAQALSLPLAQRAALVGQTIDPFFTALTVTGAGG